MSYDLEAYDAGPESEPEAERVRTGVDRVDEVIRSVEELEERPIEEHVGVFETAHSQLRRALDHVDDEPDDEPGDGVAGADGSDGA
jgi:hypothetical protein